MQVEQVEEVVEVQVLMLEQEKVVKERKLQN